VSDPKILDDYQVEREAHVTQLVLTSHELSNLINMTDPKAAEERNYAILNHLAPPPAPFPKLEGGALHREPDGSLAPETGELAPQGTLRRGDVEGRGDDVLRSADRKDGNFQLISLTEPDLNQDQHDFFASIGGVIAVVGDASAQHAVVDVDGIYTDYLKGIGADAYIMRPDWYLFGAAPAAGVSSLVDELREKLGATHKQTALVG
jgi:hypothetical protein